MLQKELSPGLGHLLDGLLPPVKASLKRFTPLKEWIRIDLFDDQGTPGSDSTVEFLPGQGLLCQKPDTIEIEGSPFINSQNPRDNRASIEIILGDQWILSDSTTSTTSTATASSTTATTSAPATTTSTELVTATSFRPVIQLGTIAIPSTLPRWAIFIDIRPEPAGDTSFSSLLIT